MSTSVLVVDDDDRFRSLAARLLDALGFEVVGQATSCASAITAAGELHPDAALIDVNLPDGTGIDLAERLTREDSHLRVVLTSSDADAAGGSAIARARAAGFVPKDEIANGALPGLLAGAA
jgi:DNA-binding NarL/FixJ family response regulator